MSTRSCGLASPRGWRAANQKLSAGMQACPRPRPAQMAALGQQHSFPARPLAAGTPRVHFAPCASPMRPAHPALRRVHAMAHEEMATAAQLDEGAVKNNLAAGGGAADSGGAPAMAAAAAADPGKGCLLYTSRRG